MKRWWWVLIGYLPLAYWAVQLWMLNHYSATDGCVVNEGFSKGCIWDGEDISEWLYGLGMSVSWGFALFIAPLTLAWTAIVALIYLLVAPRQHSTHGSASAIVPPPALKPYLKSKLPVDQKKP